MTSPVDRERSGPAIRVGDQERNQAIDELREQYALGRLDHSEFEQRLGGAFTARTAAELRNLVADLPVASQPVDWRPGRLVGDRTDARRQPHEDRSAAQGHRHWRRHGPPWAYGRGGHPHHHHPGPGFLALLPLVGMALFFGSWALMFLLPLLIGGLFFSVARIGAWSR